MAVARKTQGSPLPARLAGLLREAKWLALGALAAYLLLVFATYHKGDPGWSHSATGAVTQNAGGRVGAWLADLLLYLFGLSAYWCVALCGVAVAWGYSALERASPDKKAPADRRPFWIAFA